MIYRLLADAVLIVHLGFVLFVVLGGVLVRFRRWTAALHLPCAVYGGAIELWGWVCPLTPLENRLRVLGGERGYAGGFVEHYLVPIIYPQPLTPTAQRVLGVLVVAVNVAVYAWALRGPKPRRPQPRGRVASLNPPPSRGALRTERMTQPTDDDLLRRSGAGDPAAFEALVARYGDALFRFASRVCGSAREAEDALQDAMLAAWRGAAGFRGESAVRAWLFQVTVNACRRRARRRVGEPDELEPVEAAAGAEDGAPAPDRRVAARQVGAALDAALAAMSAEAREVLVLRDVEGMDGADVASALQIGVPAMKSRLHRARLELKERVEAILGHAITEAMS